MPEPGEEIKPSSTGTEVLVDAEVPPSDEGSEFGLLDSDPAVQQVTAESGSKIPVRFDDDYPTYTDSEGRQLSTGHDTSLGTEEKWGLGKEVEHNPARAHEMAEAGSNQREVAAISREIAKHPLTTTDDWSGRARDADNVAKKAEEEAGRRYDEGHRSDKTSAETDPSNQELYVFDPERFDAKTVEEIQRELEIRYAQGKSWTIKRIRELVDEREVERKWAEEFSGKIPLNWVEVQAGPEWFSIAEDIKNPDFELTEDMIAAAIKHPTTHVVDTLVSQRRLTPEQMRLVESQEGIPHWVIEEMREAQPKLVSPVTDSEPAS